MHYLESGETGESSHYLESGANTDDSRCPHGAYVLAAQNLPILILLFPITLWPLVHALPRGGHIVRPHRISPCTFNPQPRIEACLPPSPIHRLAPLQLPAPYILDASAAWMLVSATLAQSLQLSHPWPRVCKVPGGKAGAHLTFPFVHGCTASCLVLKNTFLKKFAKFSSCSGQE